LSEEVERPRAENEAIRQELDTAKESARQPLQQPDLEELGSRILKNLKLGTQAPGYKVARKALDQFIRELTNE
jgi:hypothetical protein